MTEMSDAPPKPKRTWIWIIVGIFAFLFVLAIGSAAFTAYWLGSHMEIVETPPANAAKAFDEARAKFPGQQPLLEFRDGEPQSLASTATPSSVKLTTLHVLAFDESEGDGRLVRVEVPFWLLRLKSGPISFSSYASSFDDRHVKMTVQDIERRGPGIVVDVTERGEGRVLVWAE